MAIKQPQPLSPPLTADQQSLSDYSSILQDNLQTLFEVAHDHQVKTSVPTSNEGQIGDIILVQIGSGFSIYAKFPSGWKSTTLT